MIRSVCLAMVGVVLAIGARQSRAQDGGGPPPRVWAVLVSIEDYPAPIAPRAGSKADGRKLAKWFQANAGWDPDHVLILNDDGNPEPNIDPKAPAIPLKATRKNLDYAMDTWLRSRVSKGDVVVLSFIGRGISTPDGEALLTLDASKGAAPRVVWSPERGIERLLGDDKCSAVLSWIDAPINHPGLPEGKLGGDQLLGRLARWPGSSAWLATGDRKDPRGGSPFAASLRSSLGNTPRSLLASLATINQDPSVKDLQFRHKGGISADLTLFRDGPRRPKPGHLEPLIQKGHAARVTAIAVRADGRTMASASIDSTIRVWDTVDREKALIRVFPDFLNGVSALAISQDGRFLAGGDGMGDVLVWDLADPDPTPIQSVGPKVHGRQIASLAFLPDEALDLAIEDAARPRLTGDATTLPTARFVSLGQDGRSETWVINGRALNHSTLILSGAWKVAAATRAGGPVAFAVVDDKGKLQTFDGEAKPTRPPIALASGRTNALDLDAEGQRAAVGDSDGRVRVFDLVSGDLTFESRPRPAEASPVSSLRLGPGNRLAIGDDHGVSLVALKQASSKPERLSGLANAVVSLEFSDRGTWLGACDRGGDLAVWKLEEERAPTLLKLDHPSLAPGTRGRPLDDAGCLAFAPESVAPMLAVGENDGGIRCWDLTDLHQRPRIAAYRGRVRRLGTTPDGRSLLQVTDDGIAQVWDLQEGREVWTLPGLWASGAFLADGRLVMARHPNTGGGLSLVDPGTGHELPGFPVDGPRSGDYARVVASRDGRMVAASTSPGRLEEVHVWDLTSGKFFLIEGHKNKGNVSAVDFSKNSQILMTAARDGSVKLWNLLAANPSLAPIAQYGDPRIEEITAACLGPDGSGRVVVAGLSRGDRSVVLSWNGKPGASPVALGEFSGRTLAVTFLGDGRHVAAAGVDRLLRIWDIGLGPLDSPVEVKLDPGLNGPGARHAERINDLFAWPRSEANLLVSGSDDATVRFWRIKPRVGREDPTYELIGTLTSAPPLEAKAALSPVEAPWVAFTPDGVYDASLDGEHLVSFGDGRSSTCIDQYAERLFHPRLTDQIRRGIPTPPQKYTPPPPLLLEDDRERDTSQAEALLKVVLCDASLKPDGLRLYQDDVPVRDGEGFAPGGRPGEFVARVTLKAGDNRFYAMASRPEDADARSSNLTLFHNGPSNPGKLHVLSLGVGNYDRNALRFPAKDARDLADYVRDHGVGQGKRTGLKVALFNNQVTRKSVEDAFENIRKAVEGHPEDTVVVFLAGHTDILTEANGQVRYSLLLSSFPFPDDAPLVALSRGGELGALPIGPPSKSFLPYATIYRKLTSLDALQRLVIVDACQAEAILNDPGVQAVQQMKAMDRESRQSRTDYFLASRRGEAALESARLEHGLLTYLLLRGMGAVNLEKSPINLEILRDGRTADADGDGKVTTGELRRYVTQALPSLTDRLAVAGVPRGDQATLTIPPKTQAAGTSFPLVVLPVKR